MATKRGAPDGGDSRPISKFDHSHKRRKPNSTAKPFKKAHPVNELKSQIRSLKRLLDRNDDLPADVRVEKERALHSAQHDLDVANRIHQRSEMIGKYHKIRFFDRQKATRRLKKAKKELRAYEGSDDAERTRLGKAVDGAETELNYAQFYPLEKAYVPLFPTKNKKKNEEGDGKEGSGVQDIEKVGDPKMWKIVQKCMKEGTLDDLREGRLEESGVASVKKKEDLVINGKGVKSSQSAKSKESKNTGKSERDSNARKPRAEEQDDDEDSDGGFFE